MDNFRILAIRTGKERKNRKLKYNFLKVLKPNTLYSFYGQYEYPRHNFSRIIFNDDNEIDLYTIDNKRLTINVNAIVGSNGSGKSTLMELMFLANYNIGCLANLLVDENEKICKPINSIDFELFYTTAQNKYVSLNFSKGKITKRYYEINGKNITPLVKSSRITNIYDLGDFFYSIVINYSHYALNSLEIGQWIYPLFHKNDGYQTPIVLNPLRDKGDININKENHLLRRRLQANILEPVVKGKEANSLRNLSNGKIATHINLTFAPYQYSEPLPQGMSSQITVGLWKVFRVRILKRDLDFNYFVAISISYIYRKLEKISRYRQFEAFREGNSVTDVAGFLMAIKQSDSHITFKIKGAILYLKHYGKIFGQRVINVKKSISLSVDALSRQIVQIQRREKFEVNTYMMAPPSYFKSDIILQNAGDFEFLSSGEKQRIHSISSIVYHLINLNSVESRKARSGKIYTSYDCINIIFDEIELYYHPEWQRRYISDLLDYISKVSSRNLDQIRGLNITFLTHSPYILSDIPDNHVLRLEKGAPLKRDGDSQTFGANIHELLANDFLMEEGTMGEWAKKKIEEQIEYLSNKIEALEDFDGLKRKKADSNIKELEYCKKLIALIGEPVIKSKMQEMLDRAFPSEYKTGVAKERIRKIAEQAGLNIKMD